ncbi:MAG: hypothetical protein GC164_05865 [Phycisphaera sp.]|nr:hypothetical protein [Phycisphaera sp.]
MDRKLRLFACMVCLTGAGVVLADADQPTQPEQAPKPRRVRIELAPPPKTDFKINLDVHPVAIEGGYAVVVSKQTAADPQWKKVVDTLKVKYSPEVIEYDQSVDEVQERLSQLMPRYTCIVATPDGVDRALVVHLHRMMRKLDDDPYTDTIWAILTGYDADDALRIAANCDELVIRKGLGTTGFDLKQFDGGVIISDGKPGQVSTKNVGDKITFTEGDKADRAQVFVDTMHNVQPDLLITSSHATQRDLQMPFGLGQLRCANGNLFGLSVQRDKGWMILSPNPKIHMAVGNCLLGRIDGRESIALALMHTGGVNQLAGYVVSTWYGAGGWGMNKWFFNRGGRFDLAESWYINNQTVVNRLLTEFPKSLGYENEDWDMERDPRMLGQIAAGLGYKNGDGTDQKVIKDNLGLVWDVDTVGLYGDPAWRAHMPRDENDGPCKLDLEVKGGQYTLTVSVDETREVGPVFAFLPERINVGTLKILAGDDLQPVITDNFILLPKTPKVEKDIPLVVRFQAEKI